MDYQTDKESEDTSELTPASPEKLAAASKLYTTILAKLEELELTVAEFADLLQIRGYVIYMMKSKQSLPNTENLARICLALGISMNEVLSPLTPGHVAGSLREYAQRRKQVEAARAIYERQQLELEGVLKKVKLQRSN